MAGARAVPIQVAVNVSNIQFRRDEFVEEVIEVLNRTGLKPELLQLELTESIMLSGIQRAAEKMKRLKQLGVSFAIDDFGTGYSCLSYLPSLPFDALKIDRSFIQQLTMKPEGEAMVHTLITLGQKFSMRVIVEGVEKPKQLQLLRQLGGDEIQGYLMGPPTPDPASQISLLLQKGPQQVSSSTVTVSV